SRAEHRLIDLGCRLHAFALYGKTGVDRAARELFGSPNASGHLDRIPPRRKAKAHVESLCIDGFDLPGPGIGAGDPVAASKSGHARQSHGRSRLLPARSAATLAVRGCSR